MQVFNVEFKARANNLELAEQKLQTLHPHFAGTDYQTDTYFNCPNGRLKWREGNIENALIYYERNNEANAKQSRVTLYSTERGSPLKELLLQAYGIHKVVKKIRKIYYAGNVKIHLDEVEGLGYFIEAEAIDTVGKAEPGTLRQQCDSFLQFFNIQPEDLVAGSYSDML